MGPSETDPFEQALNTATPPTSVPPATASATNSQDSDPQALPSHPQPQPQSVPLPYLATQQPMSSIPATIGGYGGYGYGAHAPPLYSAGGYGIPNSYGGYSAYNTYGTSYGSPYGGYGYTGTPTRAAALTSSNLTPTAATAAPGTAPNTDPSSAQPHQPPQQPSATMMLQEAMTRFARVTALVDDVLRHVHMLFDAVFGLAYAVGAARAETAMWLALKQGPVAFLSRIVRAVSSIWRLVALFLLSPMAGRFSPVALVLRILGLVPPDATPITQQQPQQQQLDSAGDERQQQQQQQQRQTAADNDSSSSDRDNADNAVANGNDVNSLFGPWHQPTADGQSFL